MGAGCSSGASAVQPRGPVASEKRDCSPSTPLAKDQCADESFVSDVTTCAPSDALSGSSEKEASNQTCETETPSSTASVSDLTANQTDSTRDSTIEELGERKVCWIRDGFQTHDPEPMILRKRRALHITRSLSISTRSVSNRSVNEDESSSELFKRASKTDNASYAGQMQTGSYFLSQASDVNSATLQRLVPTPALAAQPEDLHTLIAIDWDDTLFPTSWGNRLLPDTGAYRETARA